MARIAGRWFDDPGQRAPNRELRRGHAARGAWLRRRAPPDRRGGLRDHGRPGASPAVCHRSQHPGRGPGCRASSRLLRDAAFTGWEPAVCLQWGARRRRGLRCGSERDGDQCGRGARRRVDGGHGDECRRGHAVGRELRCRSDHGDRYRDADHHALDLDGGAALERAPPAGAGRAVGLRFLGGRGQHLRPGGGFGRGHALAADFSLDDDPERGRVAGVRVRDRSR